jgi:diphthamide biosynthesis protein 7
LISLSPDFSTAEVVRQDLNNHSDLEAWTLAFAPPQPQSPTMPQALYTGGDDSKLRVLAFPSIASIRHTLEEIQSASAGGAQGLRGHEAGVTAILPLPLGTVAGKDILLTGSYDDHVRVYAVHDYRPGQSRNPKILAENNLGGGVWRLKLMNLTANHKPKPTDPVTFIVLASCMHAGTRILRVAGSLEGEWSIEVLARFEEHKSMNYGSDVQPLRKRDWMGLHPEADAEAKLDEGRDWTIVSTSFYDRLLCVWKVAHV